MAAKAKIVRQIAVTEAMLVSSDVPETDYAAWNSGTTYGVGESYRVTSATTHRNYESMQAGNTNHSPENPANVGVWWQDLGADNRWAMFDQSTGTQTSKADSITFVLQPGQPPGTFTFLNLTAAQVQVVGVDLDTSDEIFNKVVDTSLTALKSNWFSYYFDRVVRRTEIFIPNPPNYANAEWTITITNTGADAACGVFAMGRAYDLGDVRSGLRLGIIDYSKKEADDFGGYTIIQRGFSRRSDLQIVVPNDSVDAVATLLAEARATPTVFIGVESFQSTFIYGFVKDWEVALTGLLVSELALSIEGLT